MGSADGNAIAECKVVLVEGRCVLLADFLEACAASLRAQAALASETANFVRQRDQFISGGLSALEVTSRRPEWVQIGVQLADGDSRKEVYNQIYALAQLLSERDAIQNFSFLHKAPGLRIRFQAAENHREKLEERIFSDASDWQERGLINAFSSSVYEPEEYLFGGPESMVIVHKLFTLDSFTWLALYGQELSANINLAKSWAVSLVLLRSLFSGLDIQGWEDLGVWDLVQRWAGRRLSDQQRKETGFSDIANEIIARWNNTKILYDELPPRVRLIVEHYERDARALTTLWRSECACLRHAYVGPRELAALLTVFHWNRAGLSSTMQGLLTEALLSKGRTLSS